MGTSKKKKTGNALGAPVSFFLLWLWWNK